MTVTQCESSQPVADFKWGDVANTEKKTMARISIQSQRQRNYFEQEVFYSI